MSRYAAMFTALKERGEGAFVPFVMVGDPDQLTPIDIVSGRVLPPSITI